MNISNQVTFIGRLTRDPELKKTGGGLSVVECSLAIDRPLSKEKKAEYQSQGKPVTDFPTVVLMGYNADNFVKLMAKGLLFAVSGSIQTGSYTKQDETKVYTTKMMAETFKVLEYKKETTTNNYDDISL